MLVFSMTKRPSSRSSAAPKLPRPDTPAKIWKHIYLRAWREHRGYTVEGLAEMSGVSPGLISQIENRISSGSPDSLQKLAKALKIEIGDLLDVKPAENGSVMRVFVTDNERELLHRFLDALRNKKP